MTGFTIRSIDDEDAKMRVCPHSAEDDSMGFVSIIVEDGDDWDKVIAGPAKVAKMVRVLRGDETSAEISGKLHILWRTGEPVCEVCMSNGDASITVAFDRYSALALALGLEGVMSRVMFG